MDIIEMLESIKRIPSLQLQEKGKDFLGAVIDNNELVSIRDILDAFFGPPLKPENTKVTAEVADISNPYGGIRENQTLYYRKDGNDRVLVMLWPWNDNSRFTLKVIREV